MTHSVPRLPAPLVFALVACSLHASVDATPLTAQRVEAANDLAYDRSIGTFRAGGLAISAGAVTIGMGVFALTWGSGGPDDGVSSAESWSPRMNAGMTLTIAGFFMAGAGGLILMQLAIARRVRWRRQRTKPQVTLRPSLDLARRTYRLSFDYTF